jgi:hypothetical protein
MAGCYCGYVSEISVSVKGGDFLEYMSDYYFARVTVLYGVN